MALHPQRLLKRVKAFLFILFNITQFVAAVLGILGVSVGLLILSWFLKYRTFLIPLSAFSLGVLLTLVVVLLIYLRSSRTRWLLQGYRWISAEYLYVIHDEDRKHHTQTITILLEAIRPGVDHFENRYLWSSTGKEELPVVLTAGQTLMGAVIKSGVWKYYYVHFGYELEIGERTEVKIQQDLYDEDNKFEQFLAKTVLEPIEKIILHVALPKSNLPKQITYREERGAAPNNSLINATTGKINTSSGEIIWEIESPAFGHRYVITWR